MLTGSCVSSHAEPKNNNAKTKTYACDFNWVDFVYASPMAIHNDDSKKFLGDRCSGLPSGSRDFQVCVKNEMKRQI